MSEKLSWLIPNNWTIAKLEDLVIKIIGGGTPSKANPTYYQGNIPWMTVKDMTSRRPQTVTDYITIEAITESATNLIPPDTIIIATRMSLGKIVRLPFEVAINQDLKALILPQNIEKDFIEYWFLSEASNIQSLGTGTTVKGIRLEVLHQLKVPLPPVNEQRRIVAKIEALKARSQGVKEAIADIPQLLDQFRQSVLAAAFRGDLTADWRQQNPDVEPASIFLERIRAERRQRWEEAELEKMKASGKTPKDDKWKFKYKESELKFFEDLPDIPSSWAWGTLDLVCSNIVDCPHDTAQYTEDGMIIVRTSDFRVAELDLSQTKFVSKETFDKRVKRLKPVKGDILYSREGGIFGIACPVPDVEICMGQRMMLLRADKNIYDSELLMWIMNSPQVFAQANSKVIGTASPHVNVADIKHFYLPIPTLIEQREIIKRINTFFQTIKTLRLGLLSVTEKLGNLDQSILAKAFRGELVPQDANDEPASVLLERIRAERDKLQTKATKKLRR